MLIRATIVYIIDPRTNQVLMAKKRRKIGVGKWFGYGGGFEEEDHNDPLKCSVREVRTETNNVIILDETKLEPIALVDFYNSEDKKPLIDDPIRVLCYRTFQEIEIVPQTTEEMLTPTLFPVDNLPWEEMKAGDELFVPHILRGERVKGWVWFTKDESRVLDYQLVPCTEKDLII